MARSAPEVGAFSGVLFGVWFFAVAATTLWGVAIPRWIARFEVEEGGVRLLEYLRLPVCTAIAVAGLLLMAI